jgi:hypothetical protein
MSGQQPWQAPDGRWYSTGQGSPPNEPTPSGDRPGKPGRENPEKSRLSEFREWLSTGTGLASLAVALVGLVVGGAAASKTIFPSSPKPSPTITSTTPSPPNPSDSPTLQNPPGNLTSALLPSGILSSAAYIASKGTDLSTIEEICGGPVQGATATAYDTIQDQQTGTTLAETLTSWQNAADAGQAITIGRQAVDQSRGCSVTSSGGTATYTGDDAGSPPSSCVSPGQYFATQVSITLPSTLPTSPNDGFAVVTQCGTTTIFIRVVSDVLGAVTQQTADGYLSSAVGKLDQATS